jgi:3D (Asp-Asp-Asp) domain-containing protein
MQIKSSRHGFANAGLVLTLAVGWAWFVSSPLTTVNAATEQGSQQTATAGSESKTTASVPHAQGEDVQAQAGTAAVQTGASEPTTLHNFVATAYCVKGQTASGLRVRSGIIAADPRVLPIGSIVRVVSGEHSGIYSVLDTGPLVTGRRIDIFMSEYGDAKKFGRRKVQIQVIRYGWNPNADTNVIAAVHP